MAIEKRKQERTHIAPLEVVIEEVDCGSAHYQNVSISINEVSQNGMRFSTNVEFQVDECIDFRLPSMHILSFVTGRIAWKREIEDGLFLYGLQIFS